VCIGKLKANITVKKLSSLNRRLMATLGLKLKQQKSKRCYYFGARWRYGNVLPN